ncbi:MAG: acetate--CoA ligase family protein [Rhizobiaceae bacterium]
MPDLDRLFRPKSIAVIGGGSWCHNVIKQCEKIGFTGKIWPVHPAKTELEGVPAVSTVFDLPGIPDAAFIGVNREATVNIVRELSNVGAGGAVCFASGFLELGDQESCGASLQDKLLAAAGDMPVIGPNCYGFLNYLDGIALWPDQHGGRRVGRGVAIITQSSNIAINLTMQMRGLPLAYMVTVGNQAQIRLAEIGLSLLEDPRVTALGLHIEGISNIRTFEMLAKRARELNKSIVAIKVGKSIKAQRATISHTASLAGSDAGAKAFFHRLGIAQVSSLAALIEALKLLHVLGPLELNRMASLSCSGGEAGLMADAVYFSNLIMPELSDLQKNALQKTLGAQVTLANPLDYQTGIWGDEAALTSTFIAMSDPHYAMVVVMLDFPRPDRCSAEDWDIVIKAIKTARSRTGVPICVLASLSENMPEETAVSLIESGIVPFCGLAESVEAMDVASKMSGPISSEPLYLGDRMSDSCMITEARSKQLLSKWGLQISRQLVADCPAIAASKAADVGFPVVLKGQSIAHKTEAGAIRLNLNSSEEVHQAAEKMNCDEYLVEEMISNTVAELLLGVVRDPAHGFVLTIAAGGTLTEFIEDSVSLLVPASEVEIRECLMRLKTWKLLIGYRGAPAADVKAIVDSVMAVQEFVKNHPVEELEINPLFCGTDGAIVADALIRIGGNYVDGPDQDAETRQDSRSDAG